MTQTATNQPYEPGLWKSYGIQDKIDYLVEIGCQQVRAEEYAFRDFASLPWKIRESIEKLEHFEEEL